MIPCLIINIFLFPTVRWFAEVKGIYTGKKRFVKERTIISRIIVAATVVAVIGSRVNDWDLMIPLSTMNIFFSYVLANIFVFGKVRGKFYWYKFI